MTSFILDPRLAADAIPIGALALSRVLLMNDTRYPWLVLVPERPAIAEIIDLLAAEQTVLMQEIAAASIALKRLYGPDKLNVGALGNRVRQLHVHVLARFESDAAWPGPVWGAGEAQPYPPHMAAVVRDRIAGALADAGLRGIG